MNLPGPLVKEIQEALLNAFTTKATLSQMVRFHLNENIESITSDGSLSTTVFELITWAESKGAIETLLSAALAENPNNSALQSAMASLKQHLAEEQSSNQAAALFDQQPVSMERFRRPFWSIGIVAMIVLLGLGIWYGSNELGTSSEPEQTATHEPRSTVLPTSTPLPTQTPLPTPTLRPTWVPTPGWSGIGNAPVNGGVLAIAVDGDELIVGGRFTEPFSGIARWNYRTNSWAQIGSGNLFMINRSILQVHYYG